LPSLTHGGGTDWIRQYQLVQGQLDDFRLDIVKLTSISIDELEQTQKKVAEFLGKDVAFRINIVNQLGSQEEKKQRVYRSLVSTP
jgi:hypothetical protein